MLSYYKLKGGEYLSEPGQGDYPQIEKPEKPWELMF